MSVSHEQPYTWPDISFFHADIRWVAMLCRRRHANIAVGYHAHDFPRRGHDRHCAEVASPHLHRCFGQIGFWTAALHIICHYVLYFHIFLPFSIEIQRRCAPSDML